MYLGFYKLTANSQESKLSNELTPMRLRHYKEYLYDYTASSTKIYKNKLFLWGGHM